MIETESQGPDATLAELASVLPDIYRAVEGAVQQGHEFFGEDEEVDRALFPNLVRYHVKVALEHRGIVAVEEDSPHLEHTILPNNGLLLRYGGRWIRIRKADHGALPVASSSTLESFYEQLTLFQEPVARQNLMLLWDVPKGVVNLQLVCPKDRGGTPHWAVSISHPAATQEASAEEVDEFDLPITLPQASDEAASDDD